MALLFQRGAFDARATAMTSAALLFFVVGLAARLDPGAGALALRVGLDVSFGAWSSPRRARFCAWTRCGTCGSWPAAWGSSGPVVAVRLRARPGGGIDNGPPANCLCAAGR